MAIMTLSCLEKRAFTFDEYRFETHIFDGEKFCPRGKVKDMLGAMKSMRIVYGGNRGRYFIRRTFSSKLHRLAAEDGARQIEYLASQGPALQG